MYKNLLKYSLLMGAFWTLTGCVQLKNFGPVDLSANHWQSLEMDKSLARRILALDPKNITVREIAGTLSKAPTPWIMPIAPAFPGPVVFSNLVKFLLEMGYPGGRIGNPRAKNFAINWSEDSGTIGGMAAWLYENEGMAPIIVGYSAGGIQTMAVLHDLSRHNGRGSLNVVNARTGREENRNWIWDPFTGEKKPTTTVKIPFAGVLAAGGLGRFNQILRWEGRPGLRSVPDSVEELLAFRAPNDILGTDIFVLSEKEFLRLNEFKPMGSAKVRSIIADESYGHVNTIYCQLLSKSPEGRNWVDSYHPEPGYGLKDYRGTKRFRLIAGKQNLWCAELWYGIKKHWTLSAQRVARAVLEGKLGHLKAPPPFRRGYEEAKIRRK